MDTALLLRAVLALVIVLGLILLAAWAARRTPQLRGLSAGIKGPTRRLTITERMALDARRQVVILRDGVREHVILLGASGEQVLESRAADLTESPGLRLVDPGTAS